VHGVCLVDYPAIIAEVVVSHRQQGATHGDEHAMDGDIPHPVIDK
jgi:hypothetical protein